MRTKRIASRSVIALRGDLIRRRIPAAAATHFTASNASAVNAYNWRPLRLLGRHKMSTGGGEHVGPPVPNGDEQQDAEQNRVRRKKERDLAVGERQRPGDLRGDVIADGARQDEPHRAERCPLQMWRKTYHIYFGLLALRQIEQERAGSGSRAVRTLRRRVPRTSRGLSSATAGARHSSAAPAFDRVRSFSNASCRRRARSAIGDGHGDLVVQLERAVVEVAGAEHAPLAVDDHHLGVHHRRRGTRRSGRQRRGAAGTRCGSHVSPTSRP